VDVSTKAQAHVTNTAGYIQQGIDLWRGRLHLDGGLRYDYFRFNVDDTSHNWKGMSLSTDMFLIDRSNEQVYIADDGSLEFQGPSRLWV